MSPRKPVHYLPADRFLADIKRLGLSQRSSGKFLGKNERTIRKIVAGDGALSKAEAMLIRLMVKHKLAPADVEAMLPKGKE